MILALRSPSFHVNGTYAIQLAVGQNKQTHILICIFTVVQRSLNRAEVSEHWQLALHFYFPASRLTFESRASGEEQSDPTGECLVKRCQESEPDLISAGNFFISASPERSEISLVEKWERRENCQSIMFEEERLVPNGVGNPGVILLAG